MRKLLTFVALGSAPLAGCAVEEGSPDLATSTLAVQVVDGGTTCAEQGLGDHEFRIEAPVDGVYAIDAGNTLTFRYYDDTDTVFFYTNSSLRMDGVLVHSGGQTTVWALPEVNGWPSLGALDLDNGGYLPTEAVSFCYDYELFLNPNAYGHLGTKYEWDLTKTGGTEPIALAPGQTYLAPFSVTITPTGTVESTRMFEGPVFVNNPTPYATRIDAVTVMVGEVAATVTCPVALPYTVQPFSILTCEFEAHVPDTADRLVYVDVVSDGAVAVDRSLETASFGDHTTSTTAIDECVTVYDDHVAGSVLGTVCAADGAQTFAYTVEIGPLEACGPFELTNTAWYEGIDTGTGEQASWTVGGEVPCDAGCTLTQGYWKTHSEYGPAPYDATWALLPAGAETPFFLSGASYYTVFHTPPKGNAYYVLAHQYAAAQLNQLAGASIDGAAAAAYAEATSLLEAHAPSAIKDGSFLASRFVMLASVLDDYNNGRIGPGHCDQ